MAQISIKYLFSYLGFYFDIALCWFGYFMFQIEQGFEIDLNLRNHQTIIFCTIGVFVGKIILMFVDYEKKTIEVSRKKEELRELKLKNDAEEKRQISEI